jgi:hypothetical protein
LLPAFVVAQISNILPEYQKPRISQVRHRPSVELLETLNDFV